MRYTKDIEPVKSYERDRSAFILLELLAQGERDYAEGHTVSHADVRKDVRQQLAEAVRALEP